MQTAVQVELTNGFTFGVEGEVKTVGDLRRLLKKADAKLAAVVKAVPEIGEQPVAKIRMAPVREKPAAATS